MFKLIKRVGRKVLSIFGYKAGNKTNVRPERFYYAPLVEIKKTPRTSKVIGVTPAGRKRYLEILVPYLLQQRDVLDEHHFWLNTTNPEDIDYIKGLCRQYPEFFAYKTPKLPVNGNLSIFQFFKECQDRNTIYVRFDDDICYVDKHAVKCLVDYRKANPEFFLVFGNIINNAICSHLHQRKGALSLLAENATNHCLCPNGWGSGVFAEVVHRNFLNKLSHGELDRYRFEHWILKEYERFSINFMAWFGEDFASFNGDVGHSEEVWLTTVKPKQLGRPNSVCGDAIVSHFAFYSQRDYLEAKTSLLDEYYRLSLQAQEASPLVRASGGHG